MHLPSKATRREKGAAMLELALIYSAFFFVVIAILDVGQALFLHQTHTARVRAAARYGAVRDWNSTTKTQVQNIVLFGKPTGTGDAGYMGVQRSNIEVKPVLGAAGDPASLTVELQEFQYHLFTPYIAGTKKGAPIRLTVPVETP